MNSICPAGFERWVETQWVQLAAADYAELVESPSGNARRIGRLLKTLRGAERDDFASYFIRRACGRAFGPDLAAHAERVEQWQDRNPLDQLYDSAADRRVLAREVRSAVLPVVGPLMQGQKTSKVWTHSLEQDGFNVTTFIDAGGRSQAKYHHLLSPAGAASAASTAFFQSRPLHWLGWLGISAQTDFTLVRQGEERRFAMLLASLCERFISALPLFQDEAPRNRS